MALVGGDYTISIYAENDLSTAIEFQLLDAGTSSFAATGTPIALSTPVAGDISVAGEVDRYTFTATAGQLLFFDLIAVASGLQWTLLDPSGQPVFANAGAQSVNFDQGPFPLAGGTYELQFFHSGTGTPSYEFAVWPTTETTSTIALDTTVSGAITAPGGVDEHELTLAADTRVYCDLQAGASPLDWSMVDAFGFTVFAPFTTSSTTSADRGPFLLRAGTYRVKFDADNSQTASYQFELRTVSDVSTTIALGDVISDTFTSVGSVHRYGFTVSAGQRVYFDLLTAATSLVWSCFDAVGEPLFASVLASSTTSGDRGPFTLAAGTYTIVLDPGTDTLPSASFQVTDAPTSSQPLSLGATVADTLTSGSSRTYALTLGTATRMFFDNQLLRPSLYWRLVDETGGAIFDLQLNSTTNSDYGAVTLPAGSYELVIRNQGAAIPDYAFAVVESFETDAVIALDEVGIVSLPSAGSVHRFEYTASPSEQVLFEILGTSTGLRWSLVDPYGESEGLWTSQTANSPTSDSRGPYRLASGNYTIRFHGDNDTTPSNSF
ncbi:MAG: hypothetical protein KDC38_21045, partial [Planctomycetes bacterium]|nr:hypothetical protein [Planctomycetota bacterium]